MTKSVATANRIAGGYVATPSQPAIVLSPSAPGGEHEQHDAGHEPEQRVPLLQAPATDELEHDQDEQQRRDRRGDRDPDRSHEPVTSSCGTAYFRTIAMNSASVTFST